MNMKHNCFPLFFPFSFFLSSFYLSLKETPSPFFRHSFSSKVVDFLTSVSTSQLRNSSRTIFKPVACHKEQKKRWFYVVTLSSRIRSLACTGSLHLAEETILLWFHEHKRSIHFSFLNLLLIIIENSMTDVTWFSL